MEGPVAHLLAELERAVLAEHAADPALLEGHLPALLQVAVAARRLAEDDVRRCREVGARAARAGLPLPELVDLYLTASRRLWPRLAELVAASRGRGVAPGELVGLGESQWRAADDAVAALAAGFVAAQQVLVRRAEASRQQFVDDLLAGTGPVGALVERAEPYGLALAAPHVVAVVRGARPVDGADGTTERLERAVRARAGGRGLLVTAREGRLVCVLSAGPGPSAAAERLLGDLCRPAAGEQVAVGRAHAGPHGVSRSYREALEALDLAPRLALREQVVLARGLLVYRVLLRDESAMADLVDDVLGPLTTTREGAERLLGTLEAWFAEGGNTAAAARRLHLSVRATTYRLARVGELTGHLPGDPAARLPLHVAVVGARLLDWPGGRPAAGRRAR